MSKAWTNKMVARAAANEPRGIVYAVWEGVGPIRRTIITTRDALPARLSYFDALPSSLRFITVHAQTIHSGSISRMPSHLLSPEAAFLGNISLTDIAMFVETRKQIRSLVYAGLCSTTLPLCLTENVLAPANEDELDLISHLIHQRQPEIASFCTSRERAWLLSGRCLHMEGALTQVKSLTTARALAESLEGGL